MVIKKYIYIYIHTYDIIWDYHPLNIRTLLRSAVLPAQAGRPIGSAYGQFRYVLRVHRSYMAARH